MLDLTVTLATFAAALAVCLLYARHVERRGERIISDEVVDAWLSGHAWGKASSHVTLLPPKHRPYDYERDEARDSHPSSIWLEDHARGRFQA